MSKSLGNFFTLKDILLEVDPMVLRYYYVAHHYRSPLDFSLVDVQTIRKTYQKLCQFFAPIQEPPHLTVQQALACAPVQRMLEFVYDDLNTPGMLGLVFTYIHQDMHDAHTSGAIKYILRQVLGLTLEPLQEKGLSITPEMQALIAQRDHARAAKDWKRADELRDALKKMGFDVHDKKL
jgi:cysteinyl-tRNA synthetase